MNIFIFIAIFCVSGITVVDTHYNKSFVIQYNIPGSYYLSPNNYKHAPTIFVIMYGGGGGADIPYYDRKYGSCTGQNGAYMTLLLDTNSGKTNFHLIVGKGGVGGKSNMTKCAGPGFGPKFGNMISPTNGGDTSIISVDKKFYAVCKGGIRAETTGLSSGNNHDIRVSCRDGIYTKFEIGGYTNVTYKRGVTLLERQNGENSYFGLFFDHNISKMPPGYGGRGDFITTTYIESCPMPYRDYQIDNGGSGNDGMIRIIPVAIPM